ncbi:hypothetical protein TWF281_005384 [Arthrobotrys megalospora]
MSARLLVAAGVAVFRVEQTDVIIRRHKFVARMVHTALVAMNVWEVDDVVHQGIAFAVADVIIRILKSAAATEPLVKKVAPVSRKGAAPRGKDLVGVGAAMIQLPKCAAAMEQHVREGMIALVVDDVVGLGESFAGPMGATIQKLKCAAVAQVHTVPRAIPASARIDVVHLANSHVVRTNVIIRAPRNAVPQEHSRGAARRMVAVAGSVNVAGLEQFVEQMAIVLPGE